MGSPVVLLDMGSPVDLEDMGIPVDLVDTRSPVDQLDMGSPVDLVDIGSPVLLADNLNLASLEDKQILIAYFLGREKLGVLLDMETVPVHLDRESFAELLVEPLDMLSFADILLELLDSEPVFVLLDMEHVVGWEGKKNLIPMLGNLDPVEEMDKVLPGGLYQWAFLFDLVMLGKELDVMEDADYSFLVCLVEAPDGWNPGQRMFGQHRAQKQVYQKAEYLD